MALSSGGIAQFSAGAGRTAEIIWPPESDTPTGGTGPTNNLMSRTGAASGSNGISQSVSATGQIQYQNYTIGNPGAINSVDSTKGSTAIMVKNTAAGDTAKIAFNQGFDKFLEVEQLDAGIQPERRFRVGRFVVRAAFPTLAGALNLTAMDLGLQIVPGNVANMNGGANRPGMQFGPTDVNKLTIRCRKSFAGAYDFQQDFTFAQLGVTKLDCWITYEIRIIGADNTGAAQVKFFFNEVQLGPTFRISAADGRVPGPAASGGGFQGLIPGVINVNTGAYAWYMKHMAMILTADEQGNL